ncbi:MAG TPA: phospholipase D-like domain-containing protein [Moraxellaceae bacterium]|nr:phospholipase D-like domain-containing protein [Moraxellaceae bacterium]
MPDYGRKASSPPRSRTARVVAEQAFSRAAGAPLCGGNRLRLLRDATGNYPAWLHAIRNARFSIHCENYIIQDDLVGRQFIEALTERAHAGVRVRVLYDWMGSFLVSSRAFFQPLIDAGGDVRAFNPVKLGSPFGWMARDHRKTLVVDGATGFVSGLCISARWLGNPPRQAPWRDTGVEVQGPAVADILTAFCQTWELAGPPLPDEEQIPAQAVAAAGDTPLRVIASSPYSSGLYRLDQLIAAMAQETLWLTDAYFLGTPAYVQALCAAAQDDVDVRLLVPSTSDIPLISPFSRAGYRPLLEAGVRVFEWNGTMLHAKTAVADGRWARVGSSNLNLASWVTNYELDVAVEDEGFAQDMEVMYLEDLEQATEIVLSERHRIRPLERRPRVHRLRPRAGVASAVRLGNTVAAAVQQRRVLGAVEAATLLLTGLTLLGLGAIGIWRPALLAWPLAAIALWLATLFLLQALRLWQRPPPRPPEEE